MGPGKFWLYAVAALVAYAVFRFMDVDETPEVTLSQGRLVGFMSRSREGREFFQFLGVPFAKPPTGELRYQSPQPAEKWEGVRKAHRHGSMCLHVNSISGQAEGDEDCLYLNIFCPKFPVNWNSETEKRKLPVFVYVHGGYFMAGGSNYMGPLYLMQEDVILVTINYRLNSFGFLNTGDGTVHGNMGMKDQVLALQFVQKEISKFGGDPGNVVLWGESAGAAAVHFHLLSPMSKGLFKKAIMASGTAIKPWSLVNEPGQQAQFFARTVGCPTENSTAMVQCLRSMDAGTLVKAHSDALDSPIMDPLKIFAPSVETVVEGVSVNQLFLTEHPYDILREGRAHRVPLLTGVNSDEGLLATARINFNPELVEQVTSNWNDLAPTFFAYDKSHTNVTRKITEFYFGNKGKLNFWREFRDFTNVFSDRWYIHSTKETVRIQSNYSPIYLYYFSYPLERGLTFFYDLKPTLPVWIQIAFKLALEWWNKFVFDVKPVHLGSCHGDELVLLYNFPLVYINVGDRDYELSRLMIQTWTQFAVDESQLSYQGTPWSPVNPVQSAGPELTYMHLGNDRKSTKSPLIPEPFADRMAFWDLLNLPWKTAK